MEKNIHLYYSYCKDIKMVRTNKYGTKSISIIKIPEHINIQLNECNYVTFPDNDNKFYKIVYNMLFPKVNLNMAISHVEYSNDIIRQMAIAIIKKNVTQVKTDNWKYTDTSGYTCLRPLKNTLTT